MKDSMIFLALIVGTITVFPQGFEDSDAFFDGIVIECPSFDDISVKSTLEKHDPVVNTFLEIFPNAKYSAGGVNESDPHTMSVEYKHGDSNKDFRLKVHVSGVSPTGESCFETLQYAFQYKTENVHKNVIHHYSEQEDMIRFLNEFAIPTPHEQLKQGIEYYNIQCKYGLTLVVKSSNDFAACVKYSTGDKMIERGWGICSDLASYSRGNPCGPRSSGLVGFDKESYIIKSKSNTINIHDVAENSVTRLDISPHYIIMNLTEGNSVTFVNDGMTTVNIYDNSNGIWRFDNMKPSSQRTLIINSTGHYEFLVQNSREGESGEIVALSEKTYSLPVEVIREKI